MSETSRSASIPVLYTRGTHFEVGVDIGRTFQSNIETFLNQNLHLNLVLVEKYQSARVRRIYESTLKGVNKLFPQYVDELKGIAQGAKVPFFKLFLLHIDEIISSLCGKEAFGGLIGSTSICCDQENKVVLGHSQDGGTELLNQCYIVHAHILENAPRGRFNASAEEKFMALCLPGMLPGMYMAYNRCGMAFTVNTISTGRVAIHGTPRHFLCRALLDCSNMFEATEILQSEGDGISDGLAVNMIFCGQEGTPLFHNAEVAPAQENTSFNNEALLSVLTLGQGEQLIHCNKFLRLKAPLSDNLPLWSSNHRHAMLKLLPRVESVSNVVAILGDQTDVMFSFFRDGSGKDEARTLVTGIFNIEKRTWSIYTRNPKNSLPVIVLQMKI